MLLIDTQALVWWAEGHNYLGRQALAEIETAWETGHLAVSSITFWEMGMLNAKGRLDLLVSVDVMYSELIRGGLNDIAVTGDISLRAATLSDFHKDPADRFIVATALAGGHQLVTSDREILDWPGPLRRIPAGV